MKSAESIRAELELARTEAGEADDDAERARLEGQVSAFEWVLGVGK